MKSTVPVALKANQVLRVQHGQGMRVTATSGILWLSEEGSLDDHVLRPGDSLTLVRSGKTLALAVQPSCAIVELPHGVLPPRVLEVAPSDGRPGVRIDLGGLEPVPGDRLVAVVMKAFTRAIDTLCSLLLHPDAGAASSRRPGSVSDAGGRQMTIGQRQPSAPSRSPVRRDSRRPCWGTR
jgi:hypothetical protein